MAPARQQPPPQYNKEERVLCFHMDMLYEAKVMDVQPEKKPNDGYRYKVHYKGWKNTWDDWVLADRIRPFDEEHKELAAQLHAQLRSSMQRSSKQPKKSQRGGPDSSRGSEERGSVSAQGVRAGRRGKDWELEQVGDVFFVLRMCLALRFVATRCHGCQPQPSSRLLPRPLLQTKADGLINPPPGCSQSPRDGCSRAPLGLAWAHDPCPSIPVPPSRCPMCGEVSPLGTLPSPSALHSPRCRLHGTLPISLL